jgi:hypothetical protein
VIEGVAGGPQSGDRLVDLTRVVEPSLGEEDVEADAEALERVADRREDPLGALVEQT